MTAPQQGSNGDIILAGVTDGKGSFSPDKSPSIRDVKKKEQEEIAKEILGGEKPLLGDDKRQDAINAFEKLPEQLKDMMAKSAGMKDGTNATATIDKLMAEDRLYEGDEDEKFSIIGKSADFEDIVIGLDVSEISSFVKNLLPEVTWKEPVKKEYIDSLYQKCWGKTRSIQENVIRRLFRGAT